jgi:hypothetical protein
MIYTRVSTMRSSTPIKWLCHPRGLAGLLLLAMLHMGGCARYEWEVGPQYTAAEQGRIIQLREIQLRNTATPFNPWVPCLVESCESQHQAALPCWPERPRSGSAMADLLYEMEWHLPQYRYSSSLIHAACYLNRGLGAFHHAWIVGTKPLAVAFLDDQPNVEEYRRLATQPRPTSGPGITRIEPRTHGDVAIVDKRARDAKLVSNAELNAPVNIVLLFPEEMEILDSYPIAKPTGKPMQGELFDLSSQQRVQDVIELLVRPAALRQSSNHVVPFVVGAGD